MENILNFITNNYLWFLIIAIILLLALLGYFVDVRKASDDSPFKKSKDDKNIANEENLENVKIENNMSLNEMINNSAKNSSNAQTSSQSEDDLNQGVNMEQ